MPARNIYFTVLCIILSVFIVNKTTLKDQIIRQVANQLKENCLEKPSSDDLFHGALSGLVAAVGDEPYTEYVPPQEQTDYMREIQGQYAGVGLSNFMRDEQSGEFYFVPLRNSPATKEGLKFGDRIVAVDDKNVSNLSLIELTNLLRGKEDTSVKIKIRPRNSIPAFANDSLAQEKEDNLREVTVTRGIVQQPIVSGDRLSQDGKWIFTLKDRPEIGYVSISEFTDVTAPLTLDAFTTLENSGVSKVILDFRGNPGGFLPGAIAICNELLSDGSPIVETRNKKGVIDRYVAHKHGSKRFQVAILIDEESASAAEIVSAALQDVGVAKVFGTRSYGKGTIQSIFELPCNSGVLRMTTASFWRPSGKPIHRLKDATNEDEWGVTPDPGCEIRVSPIQTFYRSLVRSVRILDVEATELDARAFAFITQQTNEMIRVLLEKDGFPKLEVAAELGLDLSRVNAASLENTEVIDAQSQDQPKTNSFTPQGRAPYFDPQLDLALDYLFSIPNDNKPLPESSTSEELDVDDGSSKDLL